MSPTGNIIEAERIGAKPNGKERRRQALAFAAFTASCLIYLVFKICVNADTITSSDTIYCVALACMSIPAYVLLNTLANNMASDIFTVGQIMFEAFFPLAMLMVFYVGTDNPEDFVSVYYLGMLICVASVYNWSMLFSNNKFKPAQLGWIMTLPLISVIRFIQYWHYVELAEGNSILFNINFFHNNWCITAMLIAILSMPFGYWHLTHSTAFNGGQNNFDAPSFSPLNRYMLIYISIMALGMVLF